MIFWFIAASAVQFWRPAIFKNVASPYFENLKHLQNLGHFLLTEGFMYVLGLLIPRLLLPIFHWKLD